MVKVSVIIPVYNVEAYLEKCLNSVINQTLQDIEILCINDGSTDSCSEILKKYHSRDNRIIVFNRTNHGVSSSRNFGIEKARGEYITFVDSDDWLELNALEIMYNTAQKHNANVVIGNYCEWRDNTPKVIQTYNKLTKLGINIEPYRFFDLAKIKTHIFCDAGNGVCAKIYNTRFIKKHKIIFPTSLKIAEDQVFNTEIKLISPIFYIDEVLYNYQIHGDSSCFINKINHPQVIAQMKRIIKKHKLSNCLQDELQQLREQHKQPVLQQITSLLQKIFSVKNTKINGGKRKIMTILGAEIKLKETKNNIC